ncbi:MAG: protease inhibitor I42 family protein [Syntrophaceae bacterium]|nr:protease inhibitor I42 family protein [Syntrophaceae bacterium]
MISALKYPLTKVLGCPKIYFSSAKHLRKLLFHSNQFEKALLKLKKSWYEKPESKLLGASGKQVFVFVPLKPGNTKIEMRLKRPWESSALKAKVYQISILPK